jgi:UDP-glucose 4-epimerase
MPVHAKRIFVTGGRGRLASLVADHFRAPAYHLQLYSRAGRPDYAPLDDLLSAATCGPCDFLLHLGWSTLPATAEQHHDAERTHDLPWLEKLLAVLSGLPEKKQPHLVFFSSGGTVYGNAGNHPSRESDPCHPIGQYGRAKLAAEDLIRTKADAGALSCAILRISNPYGYPVPKSRSQGLIPHALRCATEAQPLTLWGDGSARKDFLYYTDLLSAVELALTKRLTGTFNVASGESRAINEVLGEIELQTGNKIIRQHVPAPPWDVHDSRLNNSRFRSATGWCPQISLPEGIRRTAAGYATH